MPLSLPHRSLLAACLAALLSLIAYSPAVCAAVAPHTDVTQVEITCGCSLLTQYYLQQAALAYQLVAPNVTINPVFGISATLQGQAFAGQMDFVLLSSGTYLTAAQKAANPDTLQVPFIGVGATPIYNVPGLPPGTDALKLTSLVFAKLVTARITRWNHPELVALNPQLSGITANITMIVSSSYTQALTDVFLKWLCRADPAVAGILGCTAATYNPKPVPYAKVFFVTTAGASVDLVASLPNSFGVGITIMASEAGLSTFNLINTVGDLVEPNVVSMQLPIFERALQLDALGISDLTTATGPNVWPLVQFQLLQFSSSFVRTNCQTRAELAKFLLWMLKSQVSSDLANQVGMVTLPEIIATALGVYDVIHGGIQCAGVPVFPDSAASMGALGGTSSIQSIVPYLLYFYETVDRTLDFTWTTKGWAAARSGVQDGSLDAALITSRFPENTGLGALATSTTTTLSASNEGEVYLPLFLVAAQGVFKLPASVLAYPGLLPLVTDIDTLAAIFLGLVRSWTDPRLVRSNPLLPAAIQAAIAAGTVGSWNGTLGVIVCCSHPDDMVSTNLFAGALKPSRLVEGTTAATLPVDWSAVWNAAKTDVPFVMADDEDQLLALTSSQVGFVGYRYGGANTTDDTVVFRIMPWTGQSDEASIAAQAGDVSGAAGRNRSITGTPENVLNCLRGPLQDSADGAAYEVNNFAHAAVNMNAGVGKVPDNCYPLVRIVNVGVKASFSGLACDRGNHTLNLLQWLATTPAISAAVQAAGLAVTTDLPHVRDAYIARLNQVTCDGETMLVRSPKIWTMNSALSIAGIVVSALGLAVCVATAVLLYFLQDRAVFRSSSVMFLCFTLGGLALLFISSLLWSIRTPTDSICLGFEVSTQIGFTLTFAPLFIKSWRIYYIFERKQLKVVKLSNNKLSLVVLAAILFDVLVLVLWQADAVINTQTTTIDENGNLDQYTQCGPDANGMSYFYVLMLTKVLSLLFGACIGFATRNVTSAFNESSTIALAIWNVFFSLLVLVPIMLLLKTIGDALIALVLFLIVWISAATWAFMFGKKLVSLDEWKAFNNNTTHNHSLTGTAPSSHQMTSHGGFSFMSVTALGTDTLVRYIAETERHMSAAKKLFLKLGGSSNFFSQLKYLDPLTDGETKLTGGAVDDDDATRDSSSAGGAAQPDDDHSHPERSLTAASKLADSDQADSEEAVQAGPTQRRAPGLTKKPSSAASKER